MRIELENALAEKYAFMKKGRSLDEQSKSGCIDDLYSAFGCECADGWYGLLDEMCAKIQAVYDENGSEPDIIIDQIKEKYGTLRFYYHFGDVNQGIHAIDFIGGPSARFKPGKGNELRERIAEIVSWGEKRSGEICEECGKPGKIRDLAYIQTLCDECFTKVGNQ